MGQREFYHHRFIFQLCWNLAVWSSDQDGLLAEFEALGDAAEFALELGITPAVVEVFEDEQAVAIRFVYLFQAVSRLRADGREPCQLVRD